MSSLAKTAISTNQTAVSYKDADCASGTTCYYKVRTFPETGYPH